MSLLKLKGPLHLAVSILTLLAGLAIMANTFWHSGHLPTAVQVASLVAGTGLTGTGVVAVVVRDIAGVRAFLVAEWPAVASTARALEVAFPSLQSRVNQLDQTVAQRIAEVTQGMVANGTVNQQVRNEVLTVLASIGVTATGLAADAGPAAADLPAPAHPDPAASPVAATASLT